MGNSRNNQFTIADICVWIQAPFAKGKDSVIKDGELLSPQTEEYRAVSLFVVDIKPTYQKIRTEGNPKIYKIPNVGYLIMSNVQEKDIVSRRRAFSAVIRRTSICDSWKILDETLNKVGLHLDPSDYNKLFTDKHCYENRTADYSPLCIIIKKVKKMAKKTYKKLC